VIELEHERYKKLIIEVADPLEAVSRLRRAIWPGLNGRLWILEINTSQIALLNTPGLDVETL